MTSKFEWKEEYSLEINSVDEQHHNFFNIANKATELTEEIEVKREALAAVIGELLNYALYHLDFEEEIFQRLNYPEKEAHIEAHKAFRTRAQQLMNQVSESESNISELAISASEFVVNWITGHILTIDKKYVPFFKENGVE